MLTAAGVDFSIGDDRLGAHPGGGDYSVEIVRGCDAAERALRCAESFGAASPFQHRMWLETWFATAGRHPSVRPFVLSVHDTLRDQPAMLLPLMELSEDGRTIIEFADLGVTDYNAPLLGPAAPRCADMSRKLWSAIKRSLPSADAVRLTKMPVEIGERRNPLTLLASSQPSSLHGNVLTVASHDELKHVRARVYRKELDRSWRVFRRLGGTGFQRVQRAEDALVFLCRIQEQQERRMRELGLPYVLNVHDIAEFYRKLITDGFAIGYTVMSVLVAGGEVVAGLLGVRDGEVFSILRISNAGGPWLSCSPGRLLTTRTIEDLFREGCTSFDFTIGDYEFKRRLGGKQIPLFELTEAMSWRGVPMAAKAAMKGRLRRYPRLANTLRQFAQGEATEPGLMMARP